MPCKKKFFYLNRFVSKIELINGNRLLSSSGDSNLILWDLNESKKIQQINLIDLLKQEEEEADLLKGIVDFNYNSATNRILVQLFKYL